MTDDDLYESTHAASGERYSEWACFDVGGNQHGPVFETRGEAEQLAIDTFHRRILTVRNIERPASVELHYPDGTCARWNVSNATGDRVVNMLGTPDTLKC